MTLGTQSTYIAPIVAIHELARAKAAGRRSFLPSLRSPRPHDTMSPVGTTSPVVAMLGGGQLARMTHQAAISLGQTLRVLVATPDDPAAQVTPDVVIGSDKNLEDLRRTAEGATVVTFDHEHVPNDLLKTLVAEGTVV